MKKKISWIGCIILMLFLCTACDKQPSKAEATGIIKDVISQKNGFPDSWGNSLMGSRLKTLKSLSVENISKSKMPDRFTGKCKGFWVAVVHAEGVSKSTNGGFRDWDYAFNKTAQVMMCKTFQDGWIVSF